MPTLKSRRRNRGATASRWAHANTPAALRRRKASADAARAEIAARIVDPYQEPEPGSAWQSVVVRGPGGAEVLRLDLFVPRGKARCDQHATKVNGEIVPMQTATEIGRRVAEAIRARTSRRELADIRREEWCAAKAAETGR